MTADLKHGFRLGDRKVLPNRGRIVTADGEVHVEPRFMAVLVCLATHAGEVVDRDTLIETVWGRTAVTDDSVNKAISQVRGYLGDDRQSPRFVETIPKVGYRLIAAVEPLSPGKPNSPADPAATTDRRRRRFVGQLVVGIVGGIVAATLMVAFLLPILSKQSEPSGGTFAPPSNSIAVMPFVDVSESGEFEYFGDGLAEDLQIALGRGQGITVVARSSSFAFRNRNDDARSIGEKLNVSAVLEGTVRIAGDQLRVTAQLIDTRDGYQTWSDAYNRQLVDVFDVQDEITQSVVEALELELVSDAELSRPGFNAYNLYLQGRNYMRQRTPESLALATEFFEQATRLEPDFALAYSGLVATYVYRMLYAGMPLDEARDKAAPAVAAALEHGPLLPETHTSHALYLNHLLGADAAASDAIDRALEINPANVEALRSRGYGAHLVGRFEDALQLLRKAAQLDPLDHTIRSNLVDVLMKMGEFDSGMREIKRAVWLDQPDPKFSRTAASWLAAYGRPDEAFVWAQRALDSDPNGPVTLTTFVQLYLQLGLPDDAQQWMSKADSIAPAYLNVLAWRAKLLAATGKYRELMGLAGQWRDEARSAMGDAPSYNYFWAEYYVGVSALLNGHVEQAVESLGRAVDIADSGALTVEPPIELEARTYLVVALATAGRIEGADEQLATAWTKAEAALASGWGHPQMIFILASLHALSGRTGEAIGLLHEVLSLGPLSGRLGSWKGAWSIGFDPTLDTLRDQPEFIALEKGLQERLAAARDAREREE